MRELEKIEVLKKGLGLLISRPNPKKIKWLNFAVTYLCNNKCKMCSIWKKYRDNPELFKRELKLKKVKNLLNSKYLQDIQGVSFTGGEPFLRKDFTDLIGIFIEKYPNALYGIATNGFNTKLIVDSTKKIIDNYQPKHLSLSISLDGIGKKHDEMRGVDRAYENVINTVKLLQVETDVNLGFNFTITPDNYIDLLKVYELSRSFQIKMLVGFAHISDFFYENINNDFIWNDNNLSEVDSLIKKMLKDKIKKEPLMTKLTDPYDFFMANCVKYQRTIKRIYNCYSGVHSFFLDPYGDVYPCIILDKKMGNIKEENFDKLWMSSDAQKIRDYIGSKKCQCWTACETVSTFLRSFKIIKWNILNKIIRS